MKSCFSEFTYGFALTYEIYKEFERFIGVAPIFPSLINEGSVGGGYDLKINISGIPLFLQFKLSDFMSKPHSSEWKLFKSPYYRFKLMALRNSQQHNMLLELESKGNKVYYAAPIFHKTGEINEYFISNKILDNSIFINPKEIGTLPDYDYHNVCFDLSLCNVYRCSDPVTVEYKKGQEFIKDILSENNNIKIDINYLSKILSDMVSIAHAKGLINENNNIYHSLLGNTENPLIQISILSRVIFGCEFMLIDKC